MTIVNPDSPATIPQAETAVQPEPQGVSYSRVAARGMFWVMLNTVFSKGVGFIAQIVLGWLLSKDDYAIWLLAMAVYGLLATFRDGGLQKILIQRGKEYEALASPVFQMALVFNVGFAIVLAACSPLAARFFNTPSLPPLLWVLGFTAIISTPTIVFQGKLLRDLRFGLVARISATSTIISYTSMIAFALFGLGPLSFLLPGVLVAIYEGLAYGFAAGFLPNRNRLTLTLFRSLIRASIWIMLGALATTLINGGDNLVIGKLQKDNLGYYGFGFQFSASFAVLFALGARSVLMPTFTQFCDQIERFGNAYVRSIRLLTFVATPMCVAATFVVAPLVDMIWHGKWNATIPVIQIMTLSLVFRMLTPLALAAMEARGRWKLQSILLMIDGVGTVVAALIGCWIGGLVAITICVGVNRAVMALVQCIAAGALGDVSVGRILKTMAPPVIGTALCGGASFVIAQHFAPVGMSWSHAGLAFGVFAVLFGGAAFITMRARLIEVFAMLHSVRRAGHGA